MLSYNACEYGIKFVRVIMAGDDKPIPESTQGKTLRSDKMLKPELAAALGKIADQLAPNHPGIADQLVAAVHHDELSVARKGNPLAIAQALKRDMLIAPEIRPGVEELIGKERAAQIFKDMERSGALISGAIPDVRPPGNDVGARLERAATTASNIASALVGGAATFVGGKKGEPEGKLVSQVPLTQVSHVPQKGSEKDLASAISSVVQDGIVPPKPPAVGKAR